MDYRTDPIEKDPKIKRLVQAAEAEAEFLMKKDGSPCSYGACHILWGRQKQILLERYGIKWRSPSDMNPDICFD